MVSRTQLLHLILLPLSTMADELPNLELTPGVSRTDLTKQEICSTHWGLDKRYVTATMKREVKQEYQFKKSDCPSGRVVIDHLISRELGGADDVKNLWP